MEQQLQSLVQLMPRFCAGSARLRDKEEHVPQSPPPRNMSRMAYLVEHQTQKVEPNWETELCGLLVKI